MSTPQRPGWYPDPDGSAGDRWFNGISWSDSKRTTGGKPFTAPLPPPPSNAGRAWNRAREAVSSRPDPYAVQHPLPGQKFAAGRVVDLSQNRFATISLALGVISLFFGLLAIPAIIVALVALNRSRALPADKSGRSIALVGLALGIVGLVLGIVPIVIGFVALLEFFA